MLGWSILIAIPVIVLLLAEEGLLHDIWVIIHATGQDVLFEQDQGLLDLNSLVLGSRILLGELDQVFARLLATGLRDLVEVDHAVREVHDLEVHFRLVQLVQVFYHVRDRAWPVPLAGVLVVDETHSHDVLHREDTLCPIGVVIHQSQNPHIGGHILAEFPHVISVQLVSKQCVGEHHLGDSDRAAPTNVVREPDLQLPLISFLLRRQEEVNLLVIVDEQWFEIAPIAEPEQRPKALLELILTYRDLLVNSFLTVFVNGELMVEEEYGKLVGSFDLNLFLAEELDE